MEKLLSILAGKNGRHLVKQVSKAPPIPRELCKHVLIHVSCLLLGDLFIGDQSKRECAAAQVQRTL